MPLTQEAFAAWRADQTTSDFMQALADEREKLAALWAAGHGVTIDDQMYAKAIGDIINLTVTDEGQLVDARSLPEPGEAEEGDGEDGDYSSE